MLKLTNQLRKSSSIVQQRLKSTLVIVEHDNKKVNSVTLNAISAASQVPANEKITCIVTGTDCSSVAEQVAKCAGVTEVVVASGAQYAGFLPETVAPAIVALQEKSKFSHIVVGSSAFGKNLLPRVSALLDTQPVSDVIGIKETDTFVRTIYAGNAIQTTKVNDAIKMLSVRATAFEPVALDSAPAAAPIVEFDTSSMAKNETSTFVGQELAKSDRPALTEAKVVISGGRGLQNGDNFKMLYELADKMGAAVGASRAAVDAGFVPNDMQIGQTGKIVAPELYIGVGVSGAIQHLAGMKDSKTIACINKDPDAPIFQVADLGLVDDLFKAIPALNEQL